MTGTLVVATEDPRQPDIRALLDAHLAHANEHSLPEDIHALDLGGLLADDITFCTARRDGTLLGIGALHQLSATHAELKSMHTAAASRGTGVARAMLDHLMAMARVRGCTRVSLETGRAAGFVAAHGLYAAAGFEVCAPFAHYTDGPNSVCMTREL